ncbi:MAG: sigma 54-interacting transcriptional regulator [Sedimentibacter sp.]|uniref:sigma-54 interaction domain-containing protein n=1 Tax=Sedimentibacter sp. TaxID=1960295 RepID=UPI0031587AB4
MVLKEAKLKDFIMKNTNGIIAADGNNKITYINQFAEKILNIDSEYSINKDLFSVIPSFRQITFNTGNVFCMSENDLNYYIVPFNVKGENGHLLNCYIIIEMEGYKSLKDEINHQKEVIDELNEILEGSYDGILVTDNDGKILHVNSSYERVAAIKREDMWGKSMRDLINPVWMPNSVAYVVIEQKQAVSKKQITKDGRNIIVTGMPIFDKNGEVKKVVINARDISEIYELREELLKEKKLNRTYLENYKEFIEKNQDDNDCILAVSKPMQDILDLTKRVANFQATVLILGESGVGKEMVAKCIHNNSLRKDKPFITINCGAIPENLLESELFGYEKGAFTGANQSGKSGLFEAANGGTVFLDEVGETSLELQVKLLRFLETKEVRRVGAVEGKIVDVRIIAATNRDLDEMVNDGTFREDLFYRLNVVRIKVPPLRKRVSDIAPLSMMFLIRYNQRYNQSKELTIDVIKELEKYNWPGNIRELKNVIENMVVVSNNEYLQIEDLPWNKEKNTGKKIVSMIDDTENLTLMEATELLEKTMLEKAKIKYQTTRAIADNLGVDQSTIVRKLKKYNL